jgi:hypothetical protein
MHDRGHLRAKVRHARLNERELTNFDDHRPRSGWQHAAHRRVCEGNRHVIVICRKKHRTKTCILYGFDGDVPPLERLKLVLHGGSPNPKCPFEVD